MFRNPFDIGFSSSLILLFFIFSPLNEAAAQPDLEVSGIVVGEGESLAVVNGKVVKAGDDINGVKVIEIGEGAVKFKYKDDVFIKQLGERDASLLLRNTRRYYKEANAETLDKCKAILLYQKAIGKLSPVIFPPCTRKDTPYKQHTRLPKSPLQSCPQLADQAKSKPQSQHLRQS